MFFLLFKNINVTSIRSFLLVREPLTVYTYNSYIIKYHRVYYRLALRYDCEHQLCSKADGLYIVVFFHIFLFPRD